jgi:hypothetical protein
VNNLVAADFNGDGKVDLASESSSGSGIDLGTGGSTFAPSLVPFPTQQSEGYLAAGDFNRDGHPDIAFAGYDNGETIGGLPEPIQTNFALSLFLNAGDGTFAAPAIYANPQSFLSLATGDFDGDGQLDLAELTSAGVVGIGIFFNAGGGVFRSEANYPASEGGSDYGMGIADFQRRRQRRSRHHDGLESQYSRRGQRARSVHRRRRRQRQRSCLLSDRQRARHPHNRHRRLQRRRQARPRHGDG